MFTESRGGRLTLATLVAAAVLSLAARSGSASCNQIPGTVQIFRGAVGSTNRPFAKPGDFVELRAGAVCRTDSQFAADSSDEVVSVTFTPAAGRPSLVILAADCAAMQSELQRCARSQRFAHTACLPQAGGGAQIIERDGEPRLQFRFPDSDDLVDGADDEHTLAGPAAIAVTARGEALPCDLATRPCRQRDDLRFCVDELFALDGTCGSVSHPQFTHFTALPPANDYQALCVDPSPPCTGRQTELRATTDAAGNLLIPVDWRGVLLGDAVPIARLLRGSTAVPAFADGDRPIRVPGRSFLRSFSPTGGPLPPLFEPQLDSTAPHELTLFGSADAAETVLWLVRRGDQRRACDGGDLDGWPCNEPSDCNSGVCSASVCRDEPARICDSDADCDGECGPQLFDFGSRSRADSGLIILPRAGAGACQSTGAPCARDADCGAQPCVSFRARAEDPVPLDALIESPDLLVTVVPEAIAGRDLNGDGDRTDNVTLLHDRRTGAAQPIGEYLQDDAGGRVAEEAASGSQPSGRATTQLRQPPFVHPVVAADGDLVALLESEPLQGNRDRNRDGDRFDSILRVFRAGNGLAEELTGDLALVAEAAPLIGGRSILISDGLVFFRTSEAALAPRRLRRISVSTQGLPANGDSMNPVLAANGRQVAFESRATNLTTEQAPLLTTYLHDRVTGATTAVHVVSDLVSPDAAVLDASLSHDGRHLAVTVQDNSGVNQVFVVDRDSDDDGVFDQQEAIRSRLISVNSRADVGERDSGHPTLSPDGRFVAFSSASHNLVLDLPGSTTMFTPFALLLHDRDDDGDTRFDDSPVPPKERSAVGPLLQPSSLSGDGRWLAFSSFLTAGIAEADHNDLCVNISSTSTSCADVLLRDRTRGTTVIASRSSAREQSNNHAHSASLAQDGTAVSFESAASNLVPGDTNGRDDVFVRDLASATTERVSLSSDGAQANGVSSARLGALSADGRFVTFTSDADNLVSSDHNQFCNDGGATSEARNCADVFVHDRLTGMTERVSVGVDGREANAASSRPVISADGSTIVFQTDATNLITDDQSDACGSAGGAASCSSILVSAPDDDARGADLSGDGDVDDTVLRVFDTREDAAAARVKTLIPAEVVEAAAGRALFLVPESALGSAESDRNHDGDSDDSVAHFYDRQRGVANLGFAAKRIALSDRWIALLVDERSQDDRDLNGDGDQADLVLCVASVSAPEDCRNLRQTAEEVLIAGDRIAILTAEAMQGVDLNQDGDLDDRVVQVYDAVSGTVTNTGQAGEEMVGGAQLIAFRTSESAQGRSDLNHDGDHDDYVLQVFDVHSGTVTSSAQAATPCRFEACDPRLPYRVLASTVRFLSLESEQSVDLNGDGDRADLILQNLTVPADENGASPRRAAAVAAKVTALGAVSAGICSDDGRACVSSADCAPPASCYRPPGRCVADLHTECATNGLGPACAPDEFCVPNRPGLGTCHRALGSCTTDRDCDAGDRCSDIGSQQQQVIDPFADRSAVFTGAGNCLEDLHRHCDAEQHCHTGERCTVGENGELGCQRTHGTCARSADCPVGSVCRPELITAVARDSDGDELPDPFDNCPAIANPGQADSDNDGIGDDCEVATVPTPRAADSGCVLDPTATAAPPWSVLFAVAALLRWLPRRRMGPLRRLVVAALLAALSTSGAARVAADETRGLTCVADCDGSGAVTVDEILRLTGMVLGELPLSSCFCADQYGTGSVTVADLVGAIDDALHGCVPISPESIARSTVSLVRALSYVSIASIPPALAYSGAGPHPAPCIPSGGFENSCSEPAVGRVRIPVDVLGCEANGPEGRSWFDGRIELGAFGSCPDLVLPTNVRLGVQLVGGVRDLLSTARVDAQVDMSVLLQNFLYGSPTCRIAGAQCQLAGDLLLEQARGGKIDLGFHELSTEIRFDEFRHDFDCEPGIISTKLAGGLRISDSALSSSVCSNPDQLTVRRDRRRELLQVDGMVSSPALGGAIELQTLAPLGNHFGDPCLRGGELRVVTRQGALQLSFAPDAEVHVQGDDVDVTLQELACGSCGDGQVDPTEECDDGGNQPGDGCSERCIVEPCRSCSGSPSTCVVEPDGSSCDDGLECSGDDRCRAGFCNVHSTPCLLALDSFSARVIAVGVQGGAVRALADRDQIKDPGGLLLEASGELRLTTNDNDQHRQRILRIDPRTGAQAPIAEIADVEHVGPLVRSEDGGLLLLTPGSSLPGSLLRIDLSLGSVSRVFENRVHPEHFLRAVAVDSADEALVTFVSPSEETPGYLARVSLANGDAQDIRLDTVIFKPADVTVDASNGVYLLDEGNQQHPGRLLRVDLADGATETVVGGLPDQPRSFVFDSDGTLFVGTANLNGGRILRIEPSTGMQTQLVGSDRLINPTALRVTPTCGNGARELGEDCDDGNRDDGDGCSSVCTDLRPR